MVFFVPVFVDVAFGILGNNTTISSCWILADNMHTSSTYIPIDDRGKTSILYDSDKYVIAIHPNTIIEARKIKDENKKDIFISKLEVYKIIENPPRATEDFNKQAGFKNENDLIDNEILEGYIGSLTRAFRKNRPRYAPTSANICLKNFRI